MALSIDPESPAQELARVRRELGHLDTQCRTAHTMAMWWRARYRACEAERAHLVKQLTPKAAKEANTRREEKQADINARFGLFAEDQPEDETVPV